MSTLRKYMVGLSAVFLMCTLVVNAEEAKHFKFLFDGSFDYIDNINLKDDDRDAKFGITLVPGISFALPGERSYFEFLTKLAYQNVEFGEYEMYYPSAKILGRINFSERASLGIWDTYQRADVPGDFGKDFDINTVGLELKSQFSPKITGSIAYAYQFFDFDGSDLADYNQNKISGGLGFAVAPRTNLGIDVAYTDKDFNEPASEKDLKTFTSYSGKVKVEQGIASRSTLGAYVGYVNKYYEEALDADPVERASQSSDAAWTGGVYYYMPATAKTNIRIFYDRGLCDTYYIYPGEVIIIDGSPVIDVIEASYRDVISDRIGFSVGHRMTEKIYGSFLASYTKNSADVKKLIPGSPPPWDDMEEDIYQIGLGLNYVVTQNLSCGFNYTYGNRGSNVREDYYYSKIGFGINYKF